MSARNISLVIAFAALAMPVGYAAGEVDPKPAEPAATAPMPMPMPMTGCANVARHDHGAERGTPAVMPDGCGAMQPPIAAKAGPRAKAKKTGHDHARIHKLM
jgi:hypothetical protein